MRDRGLARGYQPVSLETDSSDSPVIRKGESLGTGRDLHGSRTIPGPALHAAHYTSVIDAVSAHWVLTHLRWLGHRTSPLSARYVSKF